MTDTAIGQTLPGANTRAEVNNRLTTGRSRRTILGVVGLAVVASCSAGAGLLGAGEVKSGTRTATMPLEPFARAWLSQWTGAGGAVMRDHAPGNTFLFGWPEFDSTELWREIARSNEVWPDDRMGRAYLSGQSSYHGKMQGLLALLKAVPGGCDTVKALVAADRKLGWSASMREARA